jgi:hypothetical protein
MRTFLASVATIILIASGIALLRGLFALASSDLSLREQAVLFLAGGLTGSLVGGEAWVLVGIAKTLGSIADAVKSKSATPE